jgi:hypothetical protein
MALDTMVPIHRRLEIAIDVLKLGFVGETALSPDQDQPLCTVSFLAHNGSEVKSEISKERRQSKVEVSKLWIHSKIKAYYAK